MTDQASSTLSMVTVAFVLVALLTPIGIDLGLLARARAQASAAAEAGALAAVAPGAGVPRVVAGRIVAANGAELLVCDCPGTTATVEVQVDLHPLLLDRIGINRVRARAQAALVDDS